MRSILFDHIAIAIPRLADAPAILVGQLGGAPAYGGRAGAYRFYQWRYEGGGRLEILEPRGEDGFLHRFLAQRGPGVHHVTFRVPNLREVCDRAKAQGYAIVGYDDSDPQWKEAFLHPHQALGIVVQFAETNFVPGTEPSPRRPPPAWEGTPPAPITVLGLRMRARSRERALAQWGLILQGERRESRGGALVYTWPGSFMRIAVEIDPAGDEGPFAIEYASERAVALTEGPHPVLGAVFCRRAIG